MDESKLKRKAKVRNKVVLFFLPILAYALYKINNCLAYLKCKVKLIGYTVVNLQKHFFKIIFNFQ